MEKNEIEKVLIDRALFSQGNYDTTKRITVEGASSIILRQSIRDNKFAVSLMFIPVKKRFQAGFCLLSH